MPPSEPRLPSNCQAFALHIYHDAFLYAWYGPLMDTSAQEEPSVHVKQQQSHTHSTIHTEDKLIHDMQLLLPTSGNVFSQCWQFEH